MDLPSSRQYPPEDTVSAKDIGFEQPARTTETIGIAVRH
jgi:hypothetical protein